MQKNKLTDNMRVLRGLLFVSSFLLIGKIFGALKEVAIANRFGVGETVDAYTISLSFVTWIPAIWMVVLNASYVPLLHKLQQTERKIFNQRLLGLTLVTGIALSAVLAIFFPTLLPFVFSEMSESASQTLVRMSVAMAPIIAVSLIIAQLSAQLLAEEKHINTLTDAIPAITLVLALLFWPLSAANETLFAIGILSGLLLQMACLMLVCKRADVGHTPSFKSNMDAWIVLRDAIGIMVVSQTLASFVDPIGLYFASNLGDGNVSVLGYASKVLALILGLGATAVGRAVLPVFSNSTQTPKERKAFALHWFKILFIAGAAATVIIVLLAKTIVTLLFERGAFTAENTLTVAEAIQYGAIQFPFYFSSVVLAQFFASCGRYTVLLKSSCVAVGSKYLLCYLLVPKFSLIGLMTTTSLMFLCVNIYFYHEIRNYKTK